MNFSRNSSGNFSRKSSRNNCFGNFFGKSSRVSSGNSFGGSSWNSSENFFRKSFGIFSRNPLGISLRIPLGLLHGISLGIPPGIASAILRKISSGNPSSWRNLQGNCWRNPRRGIAGVIPGGKHFYWDGLQRIWLRIMFGRGKIWNHSIIERKKNLLFLFRTLNSSMMCRTNLRPIAANVREKKTLLQCEKC